CSAGRSAYSACVPSVRGSLTPATSPPWNSPAQSRPRTRGKPIGNTLAIRPRRIFQSIGLTLAARTRTRICPGPGLGTGASSRRRTSGPPYAWMRRARTRLAHDLDARLLQDAAHRAGEVVVELRQIGGVLVAVLELVVVEVLLPGRGARQLAEHVFPIGDVGRRDSWRRDHAAHLRHGGHVEARLLQRRHVRKSGQAPLRDLGEHAHVAGADMLARLRGL